MSDSDYKAGLYYAMCTKLWSVVEPVVGDDCATIAVREICNLRTQRDALLAACEAAEHRMTIDGYMEAHVGGDALKKLRTAISLARGERSES